MSTVRGLTETLCGFVVIALLVVLTIGVIFVYAAIAAALVGGFVGIVVGVAGWILRLVGVA